MADTKIESGVHPTENELADYLSNVLSAQDRVRVESHIAGCGVCLEAIVSAHESVKEFKKGKRNIMKKINIYLVLAVISFVLSFAFREYFMQFLVATIILGIKWISDSKSTRMLVMIYEAWKKGGPNEASRILSSLDKDPKSRL